jgi:hypothetical protein
MMFAFLLAAEVPVLGAIGRQQLPATGCAAFLWTAGPEHRLVAMATAQPPQLRVQLDGKQVDLQRATEAGTGALGFAGTTAYRLGEVAVTLDMTVEQRRDLTRGATVTAGTLRVERPGQNVLIEPVSGLIGCA